MSLYQKELKSVPIYPKKTNENQSSLFDGAYDEQESHESFQDALREWRSSNRLSSVPKSSHSMTGTNTINFDKSNLEQKIQNMLTKQGPSLLDKLTLEKLRSESYQEPLIELDTESNEIQEFQEIKDDEFEHENEPLIMNETFPEIQEPISHSNLLIEIQEITKNEKEAIDASLKQGIRVELVPTICIIEEPID